MNWTEEGDAYNHFYLRTDSVISITILTMSNLAQSGWTLRSALLLSAAGFCICASEVSIKELNLYLEPENHVLLGEDTHVYTASGDKLYPFDIRFDKVENMWPKDLSSYQDSKNMEGLHGDDAAVNPVPSRSKRSKSSKDHVVHRKNQLDRDFSEGSYLDASYWSKTPVSFRPWGVVDTVYLEVLVIADYSTYLAHGKNLQALCKYMAAFWNAVDLRYRVFKDPKIRLNIAGLIVANDENGAPYMTKNRREGSTLESVSTLKELSKYFHDERRMDRFPYDIVVAITNYDLCSDYRIKSKPACNRGTLGRSRIGGGCTRGGKVFHGVAVIEDHGNFDGVITAAHEIGHLLGAHHDTESKGDLERCHAGYRYMMSTATKSPNAFLLSDCSISQINYFLRQTLCLRNKPKVERPIKKILPGQLLSRDKQCSRHDNMIDCEDHRENQWIECRSLFCQKPTVWYSFITRVIFDKCDITQQPLEGSPCSDGGMCLDGVCIHEKKENSEV